MTIEEEIKDKIHEAYELWMMEHCCDEIHTKDQLIEASESGKYFDDFVEFVRTEG